jgi:hypothetical protein
MKLSGKVAALEDRTSQAAMLKVVRENENEGHFLASVLCGLAERAAIKKPCEELQRMAREFMTPEYAAANGLEPVTPGDSINVTAFDGAAFLFDVYQWTPRAWRLPGGEKALLNDLREEYEELRDLSNGDAKARLENRVEEIVRENENELENEG